MFVDGDKDNRTEKIRGSAITSSRIEEEPITVKIGNTGNERSRSSDDYC